MKTSELDFNLPEERIAQKPADPPDQARLMILHRNNKKIEEDIFYNLDSYLREDDVLVFNNSKVFPARLIGEKPTGGKAEVLLLKQTEPDHWEALVRDGHKLIGKKITFDRDLFCFVEQQNDDTFILHFNMKGDDLLRKVFEIGLVPTPPYIKRNVPMDEYQTTFAQDEKLGSAAAPTAGLHFTERLMNKLEQKGVQKEFVTLHVGLGTFQPVKTDIVEDHPIHSEYYEVDQYTLERLHTAKKEGRRIIAVGTTSCRVLETIGSSITEPVKDLRGETDIFIYPGYKFSTIDGLITNFHTPYSSLLALVMAFAGKDFTIKAYKKAVDEKWDFYSLGDGMLIL